MGCNCEKAPQFQNGLIKAAKYTEQKGEQYVIWVVHSKQLKEELVFVGKESQAMQRDGICCYYLPNGQKVEILGESKETKNVIIEDKSEVLESEPEPQPKITKKKSKK